MDWAYHYTILNMMANLNRVTLVTLEDSRLNHDLEEKAHKTLVSAPVPWIGDLGLGD